jgi:hypothetical protein
MTNYIEDLSRLLQSFGAAGIALLVLAILSGLVGALESIVTRRRMVTLIKEIADLTSRVNHLESAEQRRLIHEVRRKGRRRVQPSPSSPPADS